MGLMIFISINSLPPSPSHGSRVPGSQPYWTRMSAATFHAANNHNHPSHLLLWITVSVEEGENSVPYIGSDQWRVDAGTAQWPSWLNQDVTWCLSLCFRQTYPGVGREWLQEIVPWAFGRRTARYIPSYLCNRSEYASCWWKVSTLTNDDFKVNKAGPMYKQTTE